MWFNKQSETKQKEMNRKFQEYKANFLIGIAEITSEGVKQTKQIQLPEVKRDCIEIELEPMTPEDLAIYKAYKKARARKQYEKFGYEYPETDEELEL